MRLFVIPAVYPNSVNPGSGSFVYEQTLELKRRGHDVVILDASEYNYRNWLKKSCWLITKSIGDDGTRYKLHSRGFMTSRHPKRAVELSLKNIRKLYSKAVLENGKPDVIISHFTLPSGFAALMIAKKENVPCVIVEHYSLLLSENLNPYIKSKLIDAVRDSYAFICVSESLKAAIEEQTGILGKIRVIPNLVDRRFVYSKLPESEAFVFFSAGNLNANKRFDLLIDLFCQAFSPEEKVLLRIAGEGAGKTKLEKLVSANGRDGQIHLLGSVTRDKIAEEYRNCHCFVLLSRKETFGIVYREAMATGRPVISIKNGGIEDGWDDRNGILIDEVALTAETLKKIINTYYSFDGREISRRCLSFCASDSVIGALEKIIDEAAENKMEAGE